MEKTKINIDEFVNKMSELGYEFQNDDISDDIYSFYMYYEHQSNKGLASILLEGDPGSGKTFLSEIFSKFLGEDTEYIYTQCVEETNSDRLIATYNVPEIVKGNPEESIAEGILTKAIMLANKGKKVVLMIDELDKARESLDSYFLDFLQSGKIETSNNDILRLTDSGRKNLYVIFAKNNERTLLDAFLRRCSVIKLPSMKPKLVYEILCKTFNKSNCDFKFLTFVTRVYEAIFLKQKETNNDFLSRLPSLQELVYAINSDTDLFINRRSTSRRIENLIRNLGKDDDSREKIQGIIIEKFKYAQTESNYTCDKLPDLGVDSSAEILLDDYRTRKNSGEYDIASSQEEDLFRSVSDFLENIKDDDTLVFLDEKDKEKIVELGIITHDNPKALKELLNKIKSKGNPNSKFGFLANDEQDFIAITEYKNTLIMVSNREYVSPRLLMRAFCNIFSIIYNDEENDFLKEIYFSRSSSRKFNITGFNAKILSKAPNFVLNKMSPINGIQTYQNDDLKVTFDESIRRSYFNYFQRFTAEPIYSFIEKLCYFNPELALPISYIAGSKNISQYLKKYSLFKYKKGEWKRLENNGWKVQIDEFDIYCMNGFGYGKCSYFDSNLIDRYFVLEWVEEKCDSEKTLHVFPKYRFKDDFILFTQEKDFYDQLDNLPLSQFQKDIALFAHSIIGNFILDSSQERISFFSEEIMFLRGKQINNFGISSSNILDGKSIQEYYGTVPFTRVLKSKN